MKKLSYKLRVMRILGFRYYYNRIKRKLRLILCYRKVNVTVQQVDWELEKLITFMGLQPPRIYNLPPVGSTYRSWYRRYAKLFKLERNELSQSGEMRPI